LASAAPPIALPIIITDFATNGLYLGDIVRRHRAEVSRYLKAAEKIGGRISAKTGRLWVYGPFTQLYVYARARPALLPVEQVEIRDVIPERRLDQTGTVKDVDTLVICPGEIRFVPDGFRASVNEDSFIVLKRETEDRSSG
jgi:hypothetical protein